MHDLEQIMSQLERLNMRCEIDVREYTILLDMPKKVLERQEAGKVPESESKKCEGRGHKPGGAFIYVHVLR